MHCRFIRSASLRISKPYMTQPAISDLAEVLDGNTWDNRVSIMLTCDAIKKQDAIRGQSRNKTRILILEPRWSTDPEKRLTFYPLGDQHCVCGIRRQGASHLDKSHHYKNPCSCSNDLPNDTMNVRKSQGRRSTGLEGRKKTRKSGLLGSFRNDSVLWRHKRPRNGSQRRDWRLESGPQYRIFPRLQEC